VFKVSLGLDLKALRELRV